MMAANPPAYKYMEDFNNRNSQTLMTASKDDLKGIIQNAIDKLLEQRENKPATKFAINYLTLKEYKREN